MRIDPKKDLAGVAVEAGMKRTSSGANVVLWSDADRSGEPGPELIDGIPVAQDPRIYLDLLRLPRGTEFAEADAPDPAPLPQDDDERGRRRRHGDDGTSRWWRGRLCG